MYLVVYKALIFTAMLVRQVHRISRKLDDAGIAALAEFGVVPVDKVPYVVSAVTFAFSG